ncbi:MAG TPA: DUF3606 domain-containing protein [Ferrovibrio sp.]|jgi:hypothetical protein|uniref:DUF3606 domain-containing protein n=1 Tax=Ferrovibrio sp. TaxID=1917215 RepID=UPI002B4AF985|nr:DUF3606 domain-containing protein [Ferrovibrio sp.]HLT77443.1 DUF3606 domain-containing protein [Ferrovibrio sp.]
MAANRKSEKTPASKEQLAEAQRSDRDRQETEMELDEALRDTFPASDPVSISQPTTAAPSLSDRPDAKAGDHARMELVDAAPRRVNVSEEDDIRFWTEKFGVTEEELKEAVRQAGFFPSDVADYLGKSL